MKRSVPSLNFPKSVKLPHRAVLKNHSKTQKNHKMENSIVLDLEQQQETNYLDLTSLKNRKFVKKTQSNRLAKLALAILC
jgi:hypothetical protein